MKRLVYRWPLMAEAGAAGGSGGGDPAQTDGQTGAISGNADTAQQTQTGDQTGALNGNTQTAQPATAEIDYGKMTDDEYLGKVTLPEGQQWDKTAMSKFAPLLRENKIPPEVFAKFVALDAQIAKENGEAQQKRLDEENRAAREAFKTAGDEFRKEYTPEQMKEMNDTLSKIGDETFKTLVTKSPLSNNKTMGRMLLAYRQVYGVEDTVPNGGTAGSSDAFAKRWMGGSAK